jgi:hypothetical protein
MYDRKKKVRKDELNTERNKKERNISYANKIGAHVAAKFSVRFTL